MANIQSKKKNIRKIAKRTAANRHIKSRLKTLSKATQTAILSEDAKAAQAAATRFVSALDKAAKKGVIHLNKANRLKSKAAKHIFASTAA